MPCVANHHTATSDATWDGKAMMARIKDGDASALKQACAWYDGEGADPDGDGYPDSKSDWGMVHHMVDADGKVGAANVEACRSGIEDMNSMMGSSRAMGGGKMDIPDADRPGVHAHLAAHMKDAGMDAPELKRSHARGERRELNRRVLSSELRVDGAEGQPPVITGYAAVFNQWSEELDSFFFSFREIIRPGAFTKTIREADVRALWNHDPNYVLGRNKAGTLTLREDDHGLLVSINPLNTEWARGMVESIRRGDVSQMSFGFVPVKDRWGTEDGRDVRELFECNLFDVSPVTYPAYPQTSVGVRHLLGEAGLDVELLGRVLVRHQRGLTLNDADRGFLRGALDILRSCLPAEEPGQVPHSDEPGGSDGAGASLGLLERELELLETEL